GRVVGASHRDVRVPRRGSGRPFHESADRRHIPASDPRDEVLDGGVRGHGVLEFPAEEAAIEVQRRLRIRLVGIDPTGDAWDVSVTLGHCSLLQFASAAPTAAVRANSPNASRYPFTSSTTISRSPYGARRGGMTTFAPRC